MSPTSTSECLSEPVLLSRGKGLVKARQSFSKIEAKIGAIAGFSHFRLFYLFTLEVPSVLDRFNLYLTGGW